MALNLSPQERPRTGASARLLAELRELADRYERAAKLPNLTTTTTQWFDGATSGLIHAINELEWRLRLVENEAALVPAVEEEKEPRFDAEPQTWVETMGGRL